MSNTFDEIEMSVSRQVILDNLAKVKKMEKKTQIDEEARQIFNSPLNEVKGIGQKTIATLINNGINTVDDLRATDGDTLKKILANPISIRQVENFLNGNTIPSE